MPDQKVVEMPSITSPVAVIGFSLRAPSCSSVPEFATALRAGDDLTTSDTRYPHGHMGLPPRQGRLKDEDISSFDSAFFGLSHKQAQAMDPAIRLLLKVSYEALMDAFIDIEAIRGSRTGVYVGHCFSDTLSRTSSAFNDTKTGYELVNGAHAMAANRISYFYDFRGPSITIDTACSSSLVALDRAVRDLKDGIIDRAIVGGLSLTLDPHKNATFNAFTMLSPTGHCRSFDSRADGYCRSDGIACLVLERGAEGYGVIAGTGTNSDGTTVQGITYPSASQQASLMHEVFAAADFKVDDVTFHEAHGTGTIAGDREELTALAQVYTQQLQIGSVKSNMGHAEGASGIIGLIKILLMFEDQQLYPNFDFQDSPHSMIQNGQFNVVQKARKWNPGACTISNFGFGGSNAFAILVPSTSRKTLLIDKPILALPFASTSGNAPVHSHEKFFAAQRYIGNHQSFAFELRDGEWRQSSPLVFVCNGQGSQWNTMGQDLMKSSDVFSSTMERLEHETGIPLTNLYNDGTKWMSKENSTIGIVSFQLGILAILRHAGIHPDYFLGHSLGEIVCGYLAGFQTEADVLRTALVRSSLVSRIDSASRFDVYGDEPNEYDYLIEEKKEGQSTRMLSHEQGPEAAVKRKWVKKVAADESVDPQVIESFVLEGKMAVVGCPADVIENSISALKLFQTRVACYNAPSGQTVSGPSCEVDRLLQYLKGEDLALFVRELPTDKIAYHAKYLDVFRGYLMEQFGHIEPRNIPKEWKSTSGSQVFSTKYLVENICGAVYFQPAIESLPSGCTVVEIGPASGLLAQIKRTRTDVELIGLVEREKPTNENFLLPLAAWARPNQPTVAVSTCPVTVSLEYIERYPQVWDLQSRLPVPSWNDFELPKTSSLPQVVYDLTKQPWSTLRDHVVNGKNLFPATGFIHALWSVASYDEKTEILDFRVITPLVIASTAKSVVLKIHKSGAHCEVWDDLSEVCYASGRVQAAAPSSQLAALEASVGNSNEGIETNHYYPHIRRIGYEYGPSYQLLDKIRVDSACLKRTPTDWISYMDACLHLKIFNGTSFAYPVGLDRVFLRERNLNRASMWIKARAGNAFGNNSVLLEGLRMEYVPIISKAPSLHQEVFIEYKENGASISPSLIAALLARESSSYRVVEPLVSSELQSLVASMRESSMTTEDDTSDAVVVSEKLIADAQLLVTVDKETPSFPHCVVAQWGSVRLLRCGDEATPTVVSHWEDVPSTAESFVWHGEGSSGAVASLNAESNKRVLSYEGGSEHVLPGLEKRMVQNFVSNDGRHGVWVDIIKPAKDVKSHSAALTIARPGHLDSLEWTAINQSEYPVCTNVATLNFRDVMRAMGQLKEKDLSLGLEFSGKESATQRRIFGVAKHALSTHCCPVYSFPTPDDISDEEAASIPVVYLTAYYAMFEKAHMKQGQSILIHAGTGGVGMAAIHVAKKRGFKIFTTCSAPKRKFLKEKFELRDDQIGDSRSDQFVDTVLAGTNGRGVDVVLNQLAGALQVASLRCIAPGGQFCEIGKYDVLQNTGLGQHLLASNVSFHVIDLLPLLCDPANKVVWDKWLKEGFRLQEIVPLPTMAFDPNQITEAFRFMSQGKHMGKIVISGLQSHEFHVSHPALTARNECHLITGGLGGLGLSLASRLAKGCNSLILVGRKGVSNEFQRQEIRNIESSGCRVRVLKTNIVDLTTGLAAPDRIWHVATNYRDMPFSEMTKEAWDDVVQTKLEGYRCLRKNWPSTPIVAISSVVAYYGNALQTHYALANGCLDSAARNDPCTLSVRLGALDNVGFITKADKHRALFERVPFELMRVDDVLDRLQQITASNISGVFGIYDLKKNDNTSALKQSNVERTADMYTLNEAQELLATVLGGTPDQYSSQTVLKSAGLDSLSTMEVVHHIHEQSGSSSFKASSVTDHFTMQNMIDVINVNRLTSKVPKAEVPTPSSNEAAAPPVDAENAQDETDVIHVEPNFHSGTVHMLVSPSDIDFKNIISALSTADTLVLRQADATIFNHGAPIESDDELAVARYMDRYVALAQKFSDSNTIVVVVIDGEVRGGGMLFPAMADVCIATPRASFGLPEIHRDMVPSVVSKALIERLGRAATRRLSLTGETFDAERGLQLGMVDNLVEVPDIDRFLQNMLRRWVPRKTATRFIKSELVPRNESSLLGMGTVAGSWFKNCKDNSVCVARESRTVLDVNISNGVATLTMCDDVYQNTMTFEMTSAIRSVIQRLRTEARVIILKSSLSNFHVGLNPSRAREWAKRPTCHVAADMKECYMGFVELAMLGIPIIAVLNGKVYGGGLPIALWCDYRIATSDVDVHFGNISRGMSPAGQLSRLLCEYLSPAQVMQTYLENSHWDCNDLSELGLVAHVSKSKEEAVREANRLASYITGHPETAVRHTLHLMKISYAAEVANEEAWLIAQKITQMDEPFTQKDHSAFPRHPSAKPTQNRLQTLPPVPQSMPVGIKALETYTPRHAIDADTLELHGVPAKTKNGQNAVAIWDAQEDAISMALTAVSALLEKHVDDPYKIGRIEVGTESNVDMAKSIKSYLMDLLPPDHVNVEGVDNTNACYGGTAALLNTIAWCRETGRCGIVVATDTADMDLKDSAWRGASAVAMLVGTDPWIEIHPERASCFKNTSDFLKPRRSKQASPYMQTKESMNHYMDALDHTVSTLRNDFSVDPASFDALVFHGGLCATFMKLVERHLKQVVRPSRSWDANFELARRCASHMGGLYTASLFVNLQSLLDGDKKRQSKNPSQPLVNHIGLFAYGSGSTATLMHATIHHERAHEINLPMMLDRREVIPYDVLANVTNPHNEDQEIFSRHPGIYYRDLTLNAVKRVYQKERRLVQNNANKEIDCGKVVQLYPGANVRVHRTGFCVNEKLP